MLSLCRVAVIVPVICHSNRVVVQTQRPWLFALLVPLQRSNWVYYLKCLSQAVALMQNKVVIWQRSNDFGQNARHGWDGVGKPKFHTGFSGNGHRWKVKCFDLFAYKWIDKGNKLNQSSIFSLFINKMLSKVNVALSRKTSKLLTTKWEIDPKNSAHSQIRKRIYTVVKQFYYQQTCITCINHYTIFTQTYIITREHQWKLR